MPRRRNNYGETTNTQFTITGSETGDAFLTPSDQREQEAMSARQEQSEAVEFFATNMADADRERHIPRARTDSLNEHSGRHLTDPSETVMPPTRYAIKRLRHTLAATREVLPKTEMTAIRTFVGSSPESRAYRRALNTAISNPNLNLDEIPQEERDELRRLDRAISRFESRNDRTHRVYVPVRGPLGLSTEESVRGLGERVDSARRQLGRNPYFVFNGYTGATHDASDTDSEIVLEIETTRGMFLGSHSGPKKHLLPRGVTVQYESMNRQEFVDNNGQTRNVWVVKAREVQRDERTTARS